MSTKVIPCPQTVNGNDDPAAGDFFRFGPGISNPDKTNGPGEAVPSGPADSANPAAGPAVGGLCVVRVNGVPYAISYDTGIVNRIDLTADATVSQGTAK
ncbi:MAG: hypothetical protein LBP92_00030 [Deltaproteobacteria bacterium]|jgi:hypothetical protein|nr:hypothetical protein [Deltaproteobacteria bacterium]